MADMRASCAARDEGRSGAASAGWATRTRVRSGPMLASAGVGARGSSAELSGPLAGPVRAGCGKEEGRKVHELGQQSRPSARGREERLLGWFQGWAKKGRKEYFSNKNPFLFLNSIS